MKKYLLLGFVFLSVAARSELIKLTDGSEFEAKVLSETLDSITVASPRGIKKLSKSSLHPDTLAKHPLPRKQEEAPLPPEPANLDRSKKGERSITVETAYFKDIWRLWVSDSADHSLLLTHWTGKDPGSMKSRYVMTVHGGELAATREMLTQAQNWADSARTAKTSAFKKDLGTLGGSTWQFDWSGQDASVSTGQATLSEDDLENLSTLLVASPHVEREALAMQSAAKNLADPAK